MKLRLEQSYTHIGSTQKNCCAAAPARLAAGSSRGSEFLAGPRVATEGPRPRVATERSADDTADPGDGRPSWGGVCMPSSAVAVAVAVAVDVFVFVLCVVLRVGADSVFGYKG